MILVVPFIVPIPGELARMRILRKMGETAHFLLPLLLTLWLHRRGRLAGRPFAAAAVAFLLIAGCEFLQGFVGRSARLQDAGFDLAGAAAAVGWIRWRAGGSRFWLIALVVLASLVPWNLRRLPAQAYGEARVRARFPLVADFENRWERDAWSQNVRGDGGLEFVEVPDRGGVMEIAGRPGDYYPGGVIRGLPRDWSRYRTLVFSARSVGAAGAVLGARLDDFVSRADGLHCGRVWRVGRRWTDCELDLASAAAGVEGRTFRLDDIDSLVLYLARMEGPTTVQIDDVRLK